ncbi:MAG: hypothetical protein WBM07_00975 [Chitinivibrionales bacterium]
MKKIILVSVFLAAMSGIIFADEYSNVLINSISIPLNGEFTFVLVGYNYTFSVKRAKVGAANYNRMFNQLLTALSKSKIVWVGTDGTTMDVLGTTISQ